MQTQLFLLSSLYIYHGQKYVIYPHFHKIIISLNQSPHYICGMSVPPVMMAQVAHEYGNIGYLNYKSNEIRRISSPMVSGSSRCNIGTSIHAGLGHKMNMNKDSLSARKDKFRSEVLMYRGKYPDDMLKDFFLSIGLNAEPENALWEGTYIWSFQTFSQVWF